MTDWEYTFIIGRRVARLATVDAQGQPAVVPVVYAFDGTALFTPLDAKPKRVSTAQLQRVRNIRVNPRVAVIIDAYSEDWKQLAWVHVRGQARLTTSGDAYATGIRLLCAKYPQYARMPLAGCPLIVIEPTRVHSWRASDAALSAKNLSAGAGP
jgi:PPOX class probable F420-dependent enzyme